MSSTVDLDARVARTSGTVRIVGSGLLGASIGHALSALGIDVVQDLPGVGENLQDHLEFYFQIASKEPITLYSAQGLVAKGRIGTQWLLMKNGLGATNHFESCGFIRSRPGIGRSRCHQ